MWKIGDLHNGGLRPSEDLLIDIEGGRSGSVDQLGDVNRTGFDGDSDLHWVLLPIPVLNSGGLFFLHRQFELDRREVSEVAVETLVVVPVHPSEGLQFEIVNGPPRTVRRDSAPKKFATHQRRLNRSTFHW